MSLSQAEILEATIKEAYPHTKVEIRKLGGNDWVIYLSSSQRYIWNMEDWRANFAPSEKAGAEA